ncbi:MAG: hypothetical protein O3A92_07300 [Verrucomicrobia bacterium]|nr:hypothetical protein [Verrucomicrobiota bacterium]
MKLGVSMVIALSCISTLCAEEWHGLGISGMVIKGGFDSRGDNSNYSLLIRFNNETNHSVRIKYHEFRNATLSISFIDLKTGAELEAKPGRTGDVIPKEFSDNRESIDIGSGTVVVISIALDGFEPFPPGKYKGKHRTFGLSISQFEISKTGDVLQFGQEDGVRQKD